MDRRQNPVRWGKNDSCSLPQPEGHAWPCLRTPLALYAPAAYHPVPHSAPPTAHSLCHPVSRTPPALEWHRYPSFPPSHESSRPSSSDLRASPRTAAPARDWLAIATDVHSSNHALAIHE